MPTPKKRQLQLQPTQKRLPELALEAEVEIDEADEDTEAGVEENED